MRPIPELLSPAGSLDAVRAAVANGADAVYLGASKFNARDEGAQLTLDELAIACRLAHSHHARIYLTLNILVKPAELVDALLFLGEAIDRGIDAVIVQDVGLVRLIRRVYPDLEIHGSTQMTIHDAAGARVVRRLGVERVVLARENSLDDLREIRAAVPDLGLETFIHGALCIAYSGQCLMSGMISERSANRGSCAQSCRKDYVLTDLESGQELDRAYLISARDLAAHEHLPEIAAAGIGCLKIEGRKKRPEYVATVTRAYRDALDTLANSDEQLLTTPLIPDSEALVQIYSRGFTGGMFGGRAGRDYVTRTQPDNRGIPIGTVVQHQRGEMTVDVTQPIEVGDGLGFEAPDSRGGPTHGFTVAKVRTLSNRGTMRQAIATHVGDGLAPVTTGWRVIRTAHAALLERARGSFADVVIPAASRVRLDVRLFGAAGSPLKAVFNVGEESATAHSETTLAPAAKKPLDLTVLREQLGRLGDTPFVLGDVDASGLAAGLFLPISEVNRVRQQATQRLIESRDWVGEARLHERSVAIGAAVADLDPPSPHRKSPVPRVSAVVYTIDDAHAAADAGAEEICFDPFLRHPAPPLARVKAMATALAERGVSFRLRTPTVLRPDDRRSAQKWLDADFAFQSGHLGLVAELAGRGSDVVADYATNVFNQHSAAFLFELGASRIVPSVELTARELAAVATPWGGEGFTVFAYGRPEGMTLEHCVLSAAFDREVTTCRDLCVQKHANVTLTDPTGYSFPVATDFACRNRLLHSRPVDGFEYLPDLWSAGFRSYQLVFNVPGDPVAEVVAAFREAVDRMSSGDRVPQVREMAGRAYTRGHFARPV